jgi:hypothetical protein
MPQIRNGYVVEVPQRGQIALGSSDSGNKKLVYTTSPLYDGTYSTDQQVRNAYFKPRELQGGQINDGGANFGLVDRYYQGSPDLATVIVGGNGKAGNSFAPNIGVPGEANGHNPAAIPASGVEATAAARSRSQGAFIGNGLVSPNSTVAAIVADPLSKGLGVGSGNSFVVRIG